MCDMYFGPGLGGEYTNTTTELSQETSQELYKQSLEINIHKILTEISIIDDINQGCVGFSNVNHYDDCNHYNDCNDYEDCSCLIIKAYNALYHQQNLLTNDIIFTPIELILIKLHVNNDEEKYRKYIEKIYELIQLHKSIKAYILSYTPYIKGYVKDFITYENTYILYKKDSITFNNLKLLFILLNFKNVNTQENNYKKICALQKKRRYAFIIESRRGDFYFSSNMYECTGIMFTQE